MYLRAEIERLQSLACMEVVLQINSNHQLLFLNCSVRITSVEYIGQVEDSILCKFCQEGKVSVQIPQFSHQQLIELKQEIHLQMKKRSHR